MEIHRTFPSLRLRSHSNLLAKQSRTVSNLACISRRKNHFVHHMFRFLNCIGKLLMHIHKKFTLTRVNERERWRDLHEALKILILLWKWEGDGDENDVEKHWLVFKEDELIIILFGRSKWIRKLGV